MLEHHNKARLNIKSYFWTMLFAFPALCLGISLANTLTATGNADLNIGAFARVTSLFLAALVVIWTVKRLHDANKSGWWSLLLLPPATLFFLIYLFFLSGSKEANRWGNPDKGILIYGIRFRGFIRGVWIVLVSIFMIYLIGLYSSFLFSTS